MLDLKCGILDSFLSISNMIVFSDWLCLAKVVGKKKKPVIFPAHLISEVPKISESSKDEFRYGMPG